MRPSVFLSRPVPDPVRRELEASFVVRAYEEERPLDRCELLAKCAGSEGLVTVPADQVDEELLDAAGPQLRVVANYAVGLDNVDIAAATRRRVLVTNTPGVLTQATAELTIGLVIALARRLTEGDRLLRSGADWGWGPTFMLGRGLSGRVLGIVGLGRIGKEVARLAEAFGMEVVYVSRRPRDDVPYRRLALDGLLQEADVVSLHAPLTEETEHLIAAAELRRMKPTALLVNTARGPLVDEAALADALIRGQIAGAALDVFEREPDIDARLLLLENVVLSPHLGSATDQARVAMGMLSVEALRAVLLDETSPPNAVNPEAWAAD